MEGTVRIENNADVNLNVSLNDSTGADRLPEFDMPHIYYWHTHPFGPRHAVWLIEENPYYPARDDETDKRIIQGVAAKAGNPPYSYALTGVPDGMVFDPDTRILHGTPAVGTALIWEGGYSITDADGDTIETEILFIVFSDSDPYFDSTVDNQIYRIDSEIAPLQLPEVKWTDITPPENITDRSVDLWQPPEGWRLDDGFFSDLPNGLWRSFLYVHNLEPAQWGTHEPAASFITGTPQQVGTFPITYTVIDSNDNTATVEFTITVFDPDPDPEPLPRPVVSFATSETHLSHVWGAEGSVNLSIYLSLPAPQPLSIDFVGFHSGSVMVPEGSSRATISVPLKAEPLVQDGGTLSTAILLVRGDGYDLYAYEHRFRIKYLVDDPRCPYPIPHTLLERASSSGALCATGTNEVSQSALDRVSGLSASMLQHRADLANQLAATSHVIMLYGQVKWCEAWPVAYYSMGCSTPRTSSGIYAAPIIVCPENSIAMCVHEIAHAVHAAGDDSEDAAVERRFSNPEVQELWSGYALTNHREFFAEMSAIYFCVGTGATFPTLHCADELQAYDPETYEVVHAIYRGSADLR